MQEFDLAQRPTSENETIEIQMPPSNSSSKGSSLESAESEEYKGVTRSKQRD